tara:strand:+ start:3817 stop:4047 length:231 start_codon:yes stop_codon:yes gene_type:complete
MRIEQNKKTGEADLIFTWKEVWTLIKYRRLRFTQESFRAFGGTLLTCIMNWNMYFDNPFIKDVEVQDKNPDAKTDK